MSPWIVLLSCAGAFFLVLILVKFVFYPKKIRITQGKKITKEFVARKFDDLLALRAILVISRDTGLLLYSWIPETDDTIQFQNAELVSGVLHALRSIGQEMGFKDQEFTRLQYGDYYLTSNTYHNCQVVAISRNQPSSIIEDNLLILNRSIQKKFFHVFQEGNCVFETSQFLETNSLIREIFDTFFIEGLGLLYDPANPGDVSKLGLQILERAKKQHDECNVVVLKQLFVELFGGFDEEISTRYSREEVIYEMYQLFKQNYFYYLD